MYQKIGSDDGVLNGLKAFISFAPAAVLFSLFLGAIPVTGIYTAVFAGLLGLFSGGQPGITKGATPAILVVMVTLAHQIGLIYLLPLVILAALLQWVLDYLQLEDLLRLISRKLILTLVNVFAFIVFIFQYSELTLGHFTLNSWAGTTNIIMSVLILLHVFVYYNLPKLVKVYQASLAAIVLLVAVVFVFKQYSKPIEGSNAFSDVFLLFQPAHAELTIGVALRIIISATAIAGLEILQRLLKDDKAPATEKTQAHSKA